MQPSLQTLVQQSFALGPFQQSRGRAAVFSTRFGLCVLVLDTFAAIRHSEAVTPGERGALQTNGIVVAVAGYFYLIAGRNNAEWFFAGSILDRFAASLLAVLLVLTGNALFKQVAGQIVLDIASALITYKLYQQDLADRQQQQK